MIIYTYVCTCVSYIYIHIHTYVHTYSILNTSLLPRCDRLTLSASAGAPLDLPENMALFNDAILAGRWLPVPCWRAVDTDILE